MKNGDQFRHLGHFDLRCRENADRPADDNGAQQHGVIVDLGRQDRRQNGDRHADNAVDIAAPRGFLVAQITMMPLIALVTLISGVCSAGVTFQITW